MKKIFLFLSLFSVLSLSAQNRKIEFIEKPWNDILAMAGQQNKLVFLDAYTSWCGPCKWMAKNMFTRDSVADYYNNEFICASIDMEKGEGPELAKKYQVRVYPTLLFINSDGEVVHRKAGALQKTGDYIELGNTAKDPEKRFGTLDQKYRNGDRNPSFICTYLKQMSDAYIPVDKVLNDYFSSQKEEDLTKRDNWNIIYFFVTKPDSPQFIYLLNHRDQFGKLYTNDSVTGKIVSVYESSLIQIAKHYNLPDSVYLKAKEKVRATGIKEVEKSIFNSDLIYFQVKQRKNDFLELTYNDLDKYYPNNAEMLNNIAWSYNGMTTEKKYLDKALAWSSKAVKLENNPAYIDTYARLLSKTGDRKEALKQEKKAIEIAKSQGKPTEEYDTFLQELLKQ